MPSWTVTTGVPVRDSDGLDQPADCGGGRGEHRRGTENITWSGTGTRYLAGEGTFQNIGFWTVPLGGWGYRPLGQRGMEDCTWGFGSKTLCHLSRVMKMSAISLTSQSNFSSHAK